MAAASIHVMGLSLETYEKETQEMQSHINVGTGEDVSIRELAETIKSVVGYQGEIIFNTDMPDGAPRKLLDVSLLRCLGWHAKIPLREGLDDAYAWFLSNQDDIREA